MSVSFSVCIPAHEDAAAVRRAVERLRSQSVGDWECVVSDDSRSDAVEDCVSGFGDARIRYFRNAPSLGAPANWNAALRKARGRIVTLLHQDDFYSSPDVLLHVQRAFASGGIRVAVCARELWRNGAPCARYADNRGSVAAFLRRFPQRSLVVNRMGHPSVIFLEARLAGILFDERLLYFLDTEWYSRLWREAGDSGVCHVPEAFVAQEMGRPGQLSARCVLEMRGIAAELAAVLEKCRATPEQEAQAFARLFVSHARHLGRDGLSVAFETFRSFSPWGKMVFAGIAGVLSLHMLYRGARKFLGLRPWG